MRKKRNEEINNAQQNFLLIFLGKESTCLMRKINLYYYLVLDTNVENSRIQKIKLECLKYGYLKYS